MIPSGIPDDSLLLTIQLHRDLADVLLLQLSAPRGCHGQEQEMFLDVGGEVEEGENLCQPSGGDLSVVGECGLVGDLSGAQEFLAVDG